MSVIQILCVKLTMLLFENFVEPFFESGFSLFFDLIVTNDKTVAKFRHQILDGPILVQSLIDQTGMKGTVWVIKLKNTLMLTLESRRFPVLGEVFCLFWVSSVWLYLICLLHLHLLLYLHCLVWIVVQFLTLSGITELIRRTKLILVDDLVPTTNLFSLEYTTARLNINSCHSFYLFSQIINLLYIDTLLLCSIKLILSTCFYFTV